jgi:hypothetical protein
MGGDDSATNLVKLTIEEHAEAHRKLYEEHGNKFDYIAYMALSNQIGYEEANYMKYLVPRIGLQKVKKHCKKQENYAKVKKIHFMEKNILKKQNNYYEKTVIMNGLKE